MAIVVIVAGLGLLAITQIGSRVTATNGGIAIGGDVSGSAIDVGQ